MNRGFAQQLAVFAAIFLLLQIGLDWMQGVQITLGVFLTRLLGALIATAIYGAIVMWLSNRKKGGE